MIARTFYIILFCFHLEITQRMPIFQTCDLIKKHTNLQGFSFVWCAYQILVYFCSYSNDIELKAFFFKKKRGRADHSGMGNRRKVVIKVR